MTNDETMTKSEARRRNARGAIRASSIGFLSSFVIRISSFSSGPTHSRYFRQRENSPEDVHRFGRLQFIHRDGSVHAEPAGFRPPQILEMRSATERLADIVRVGPNVKALAANHAEINFRRLDPVDRIPINMHQAWFALDGFSLAGKFVERNAALFDGRNHWRHLVKIA